jgi:hypothetical protein
MTDGFSCCRRVEAEIRLIATGALPLLSVWGFKVSSVSGWMPSSKSSDGFGLKPDTNDVGLLEKSFPLVWKKTRKRLEFDVTIFRSKLSFRN